MSLIVRTKCQWKTFMVIQKFYKKQRQIKVEQRTGAGDGVACVVILPKKQVQQKNGIFSIGERNISRSIIKTETT